MDSTEDKFDWKDFIARLFAIAIIGVSGMLTIVFLCACFIYFPKRGLSSEITSLGQYGDFFGGIVGTIISITSLGVTIYLALILNKIEKRNSEEGIRNQRISTLIQIKYQEFNDFRVKYDHCFSQIESARRISDLEFAVVAKECCSSLYHAAKRLEVMFDGARSKLKDEFGFYDLGETFLQGEGIAHVLIGIINRSVSIDEQANSLRSLEIYFETLRSDFPHTLRGLSEWVLEESTDI